MTVRVSVCVSPTGQAMTVLVRRAIYTQWWYFCIEQLTDNLYEVYYVCATISTCMPCFERSTHKMML